MRAPARALAVLSAGVLSVAALVGPAGAATDTDVAPSGTGLTLSSTTPTLAYRTAQARIASVLPGRVAASPALGSSRTGIVADAGTGSVAWSSGATTPMRGASVTKLATAVASLSLLGAGAHLPTRVVDGRSATEVVLVGGGDPMLTSAQLSVLAQRTAAVLALRAPAAPLAPPATPTSFRVVVRLDDSRFPAPSSGPGWLSTYVPSEVTPIRALVRDRRNVADTSVDAATYFAARLSTALTTTLAARTDLAPSAVYGSRLTAAAGAHEVARVAGNTVGEALRSMLLVSDNDIAEIMFRNNAVALRGSATWADGKAATAAVMASLGIDTTSWVVLDGSGLSRWDRLTARGIAQLLSRAASPGHPELLPLRGYLPVAARSGTLATSYKRFTTTPTRCAAGIVWGKTGSLSDTIALAGYAMGSDDRLKAYAVLVHRTSTTYSGLTIRQQVDRIPATATACY